MTRTATRRLLLGAVLLVIVAGALTRLGFGLDAHTVLSDSMRPAYQRGDVVVTRLEPVNRLHVGQIAMFTPPGMADPVAHRVIRIEGSATDTVVLTKGDANPAPDAWRAHLLRGRVPVVVATVPRVGALILSLRANLALTRAVLFGLLGCALSVTAAVAAARTLSRPAARHAAVRSAR